jgi:septum formation protein
LSLLQDIGVTPNKVIAAGVNETPELKELPRPYAQRIARDKLAAVAAHEPRGLILAADTVVGVGRRILPKAGRAQDVRDCLKLLSGRRHMVYTAVAIRTPQNKIIERVGESVVAFRKLMPDDIDAYVKSGEGLGKAGGYAIQGLAAAYIRFISGSYSNIVGLPLFDVAQMLKGCGYDSTP